MPKRRRRVVIYRKRIKINETLFVCFLLDMTSVLYIDRLNCSQPSHLIRFGLLNRASFFFFISSIRISFLAWACVRVKVCLCISHFFLLSSPHPPLPLLCGEWFALVRGVLCCFCFFWYSIWFVDYVLLYVWVDARAFIPTCIHFYIFMSAVWLCGCTYIYVDLYLYAYTRTLSIMYLLCLLESVFLVLTTHFLCRKRTQFGFLTHARHRRVLIHSSTIVILPQLSDNDILNTPVLTVVYELILDFSWLALV